MISIDDITVTFGAGTPNETRALAGLSVSIEAGQFVTVIGSNGSGKSTLLNAVAGEIPVERGAILIDNVDVTRCQPHRRARLIARVFQDPMAGTCDSLTVEQNMALASCRARSRWLRPALSETERERFHLALIRLGLENRLGDLIGMLSGGQRQAISLIMATLAPLRIGDYFVAKGIGTITAGGRIGSSCARLSGDQHAIPGRSRLYRQQPEWRRERRE
jgi:putative tryptophan/tyrosine transport system ATP-binding protein